MSFAGFDEIWLLMCAGVPELGAIGATSVMRPWLTADALDAATLENPRGTEIHAGIHSRHSGRRGKALYQWQHSAAWSKSTIELPPAERAPDFRDYKNDPDLLNDPEGWRDREIKRVLAELRQAGETQE
jgi:hypothetical protein